MIGFIKYQIVAIGEYVVISLFKNFIQVLSVRSASDGRQL